MTAAGEGRAAMEERAASELRALWAELARRALQGADPEGLRGRTGDGIDVEPVFFRGDTPWTEGVPGERPLLRGARASGISAGWTIAQLVREPEPEVAAEVAAEERARGAEGIVVQVARAGDPASGVLVLDVADARTLLGAVAPDTPLFLDAGHRAAEVAALVLAAARETGSGAGPRLHAAFDPLTALAAGEPVDVESAFRHAAGLVEVLAQAPESRALAADGTLWHDAGATTGQMLALVLATLAEALRRLDALGVAPERTLAASELRIALDSDIFGGIAALRALRRLFASLAAAAGAGGVRPRIHAITARRIYTRYDPWTNMLRATAATMAAVLGGADVITTLPFDHALGLPDRFSRRIARNTQLIARLESGLHRVIDPGGGAPYVKHLADGLARTAWELFRKIEAGGGILAALERGEVQEMLARARDERERRIRTREELVVGVADFPDLAERRPQPRTPDPVALRARMEAAARRAEELPADFTGLVERAAAGASFRHPEPRPRVVPLPRVRLAEPFERLRDVAESRRARGEALPRAVVFGIGRPREYVDRSGFAKNLFEAGGFPTVEIAPVSGPEEAARAFREGGYAMAALAAADGTLEGEGGAFATALREAGARHLFLVGRPGRVPEGVDGVLKRGIDVVALLAGLWRSFGEEVAA